MSNNREKWSSKASFILAAAGSAVGLGNIWKFPYIAGENGGAAFLFIYMICIVLIGLPILNIEILLGRTTQKNPVGAFKTLSNKPFWSYVGALGVLASFTILSFYSIVGGWSIAYTIEALKGFTFETPLVAGEFFDLKNSNPLWVIGYHTIFFLMVMGIILSGVRAGLEKASKYLMPALFLILAILVIQGLMLPGANSGVAFLFDPDWSKINGQTFLLALGHAFFTLSLGMGAMMTYGSYLSKEDDIVNASYLVAFLDTFIAIMAGIAIFTVVFSSGYDPTAGPGLVFHVLPPLLSQLTGGYFFALLFFILLSIAAVTSAISILEVSVAYLVDELSFSRKKATIAMGILVYIAAIPNALSFNVLSDVYLLGTGLTFFDMSDYLASNLLLPLGGFFLAIFAGYVWGVDQVVKNLLVGKSNSTYFSNSILKSKNSIITIEFIIKTLVIPIIFIVLLNLLGIL
jgi:neurotransmitter:Na+ symporter, NSS family